MRYKSDHKETTRARLLAATGALVKQKGFAATGVDGLMAAAGLTSGAFYAHFRSKHELLEAIIENELNRSLELFACTSAEQTMTAVAGYLTEAHVRYPESGCAIPALAPEVARAGESTQQTFERGMSALQRQIQNLVGDDATAWAIIAQLVGAVTIARAIPEGDTRKALLKGVLQQVKAIVELKK